MDGALDELLRHPGLWRARDGVREAATAPPVVASGFAVLDECLPGGGWPLGALAEILHPLPGMGELSLVLPALAELSRGERWIAWIAPPFLPAAPALEAHGVDLARLMVVRDADGARAPWAAEQALRCGACAAVLWWPQALSRRRPGFRCLRRLQLAAEQGAALGVVFRAAGAAAEASPAALRLALQRRGEALEVAVIKSRGGRRARVQVMPWQP
jgi:cell division inhibitor SulA/protein ImuA